MTRTPTLKESNYSDFQSYTCYEQSPFQFIFVCNTQSGIVQILDKVPGVVIEELKSTKYNLHELSDRELITSLKPGVYHFDVVAYSSQQFLIVDILYDSNVKLDNFKYIDRLNHIKSVFSKPCKYIKIKSTKSFDVRTYNGMSNLLILKDNDSILEYNTDYKIKKLPNIYKIVGEATVSCKSNFNFNKQAEMAKQDAGYEGDDIEKIKELVKSRQDLFEKEKKIYIVADKNNVIFGYTPTIKNNKFTQGTVNDASKYKWIYQNAKYKNIVYYRTPCLGAFYFKVSNKSDLSKLNLVRQIRPIYESEDSEVEACPLSMNYIISTDDSSATATNAANNNKKNLASTLLSVVKRLNYYIFDENVEDYQKYKGVLIDLINHLNSQNGGGPISLKSLKRNKDSETEDENDACVEEEDEDDDEGNSGSSDAKKNKMS